MSNKLKVLILTDSLANGGAERQLTLLAKYLPPDWETHIWSMSEGPYAGILKAAGIPVNICKRRNKKDITPMFHLWRLIKDWKPDVIHSWHWMPSAAAILVCKRLKIPLIDGTIRMGRKPPRRSHIDGFIRKFADRVIANSQAGLNAWGINSKQGRVIYNGFDPERLPLAVKEVVGDGLFRVIMTGRMVKEKDYTNFIQAARILSQKEVGWRFIALGGGPERSSNLFQSEDLIQKGVMEFPPPDLEVLKWVRQADVGMLVSNPLLAAEGCSNSIMEYMACGLPVICSDGGGNHEIVDNGRTGFVIPALNYEVLVEKLIFLKQNPKILDQMGTLGKNKFQELFKVETMVKKTIAVYQEAIRH
jgi:glycosyltransferase involved in cell wall biosynthesis